MLSLDGRLLDTANMISNISYVRRYPKLRQMVGCHMKGCYSYCGAEGYNLGQQGHVVFQLLEKINHKTHIN